MVCKTNKHRASNRPGGRGGDSYTCVHVFCDEVTIEVTIEVTMAKKRKKLYDISFKLKAVESKEKKSKEAAAREFGVDAKSMQLINAGHRLK